MENLESICQDTDSFRQTEDDGGGLVLILASLDVRSASHPLRLEKQRYFHLLT